jgi:hypothetical protein
MESDREEDIEQMEQAVYDLQGFISGLIGGLRTDVFYGKRTQANADEIIGLLTIIDEKLEKI